MNDTVLTYLITALLFAAVLIPYIRYVRRRESRAKKKFEELKITGLHESTTMHPHIDVTHCIGCGGCVRACPEGDVLGIIEMKATLIHGAKCVGHGLCADACPVGAIELLPAKPSRSAGMPILTEHFETTVPGVFIIGELGGLGLIKNAMTQGVAALRYIVQNRSSHAADLDVVIVGAGPSGLAAGLTAAEERLRYEIIEQNDIGGTILHFPRAKIVMTAPVELPIWGKLKLTEVRKEALLEIWERIIKKAELTLTTNEKVTHIERREGIFTVTTSRRTITASTVVLALGRRGTPRTLGVQGEGLSKVMYRLIDASQYQGKHVLVVGGGDAAVEAAVGLAMQPKTTVTLSYRKGEFSRIKERNSHHIQEQIAKKSITVLFHSEIVEIREHDVALSTPNGTLNVPNEFVFIFAGGEMPFDFLAKIGIQMHQVQIS